MASEKRSISVDDLYRITTIEDPRLSPDGQWIAYVQVTVDKMDNSYRRNIWLVSTDGGDPVQMTRSGKDSQPRWSPDGTQLAFVSSRDKKPQIYLLRVAVPGGEARPLTTMPNGAGSPAWSPNGTQIAFLANVNSEERAKEDRDEEDPQPASKLEARQQDERREHEESQRWEPRPIWRIPYRAGTSYLDDRYAQIYVMSVLESDEKAKPRRLTDIDAHHDQPHWSPDGNHILTARSTTPDADQPTRQNTVFRIQVESAEAEQLTGDSHSDFTPLPSPDGAWIAYLRLPRGEHYNERDTRLALIPTTGGEPRDLNAELDRAAGTFRWLADSSALIFSAETEGSTHICRAPVADSPVETLLTGVREIASFDISADGGIAFTAATPDNPSELYWLPTGAAAAIQMTNVNQAFLDSVTVQPTHEIRFTADSGDSLQGWYLLPVGYEEGQQYPLALNIHGGPHIMWSASTQSMWHENQCLAAAGYVVFFCNPRGSAGYGEAFQIALHAQWGDVAYNDIMAGVDTMIAKGFVDADRLAVTGGSYGGYMTAWIISHTGRFKAAVSQRGVYNLLSFFGTTDIPMFLNDEWGTLPWDDPVFLWEHSPIAHAHKIKTPLLIEHGENDFRVPVSEAEQLFAYIRRNGGTVKMIRFPRAGHEMSRSGEPQQRASRLNHIIEWFNTYCLGDR